ncbi:hypothetical protein GGTG_03125 [Gaeumannomyces tritici R3-111a-1]|uniref:Uncharacterized protein n=1 Tax=Gaeumannomyces tritici (strain R3-111a-1) TaxID=644352 RepID=J3NPB7_GAET3|nr:hypothetical protein GGTG_03125 [Gaeumannomyces tritici R3-111a-1]EJT78022.1 hypothetical protein GGTG_03125 [Gaeumannomyces tritici R3-111a-1]
MHQPRPTFDRLHILRGHVVQLGRVNALARQVQRQGQPGERRSVARHEQLNAARPPPDDRCHGAVAREHDLERAQVADAAGGNGAAEEGVHGRGRVVAPRHCPRRRRGGSPGRSPWEGFGGELADGRLGQTSQPVVGYVTQTDGACTEDRERGKGRDEQAELQGPDAGGEPCAGLPPVRQGVLAVARYPGERLVPAPRAAALAVQVVVLRATAPLRLPGEGGTDEPGQHVDAMAQPNWDWHRNTFNVMILPPARFRPSPALPLPRYHHLPIPS